MVDNGQLLARLGEPSTVEPKATNLRDVCLDRHPIATFVFRYRPLGESAPAWINRVIDQWWIAMLQAQGIVPRAALSQDGSALDSQSQGQAGPSRRPRAQAPESRLDTTGAGSSGKRVKRARTDSEEAEVKAAMDADEESEDDELSALKASASALQVGADVSSLHWHAARSYGPSKAEGIRTCGCVPGTASGYHK